MRPLCVLENRSAGIAQVQLSLPETAFNLVGVGDVAAAKAKGIGRARGSLLRRSTVFSKRSRIADEGCDQRGRDEFSVRHIQLFLISLDRTAAVTFTRPARPCERGCLTARSICVISNYTV